jgi:hypothetical protein
MKSFLVCSGVRGREKSLEWITQLVEDRHPDGLLFAGGVLHAPRQYAPHTSPWRLNRTDALFVERFLQVVGGLKIFSAIIPGPGDIPLQDFLRMGMHAEIDYPGIHLVHGTVATKANVAVCGVGGLLVADAAPQIESCSNTLAEYFLRPLWSVTQPCKILLLSAPPPGGLGGHSGSRLSSFFINSYHPTVCVVGGDSDRRGAERVAHTLVINPGSLAEGHAVWLDLREPVERQVELLDFHQSRVLVDFELGVTD